MARAVSRRRLLLGSVALASSLGLERTALAGGPELLVVVNPANNARLSGSDIEQIYRSTRRFWSDGKPIVAFNFLPGTAERVAFDRAVLGLEPAQVSRYWIDRKIRGGDPPPRSVPNAPLIARLVAQLGNGIGYVPSSLATSEVRVVARIRGRELLTGRTIFQSYVEKA